MQALIEEIDRRLRAVGRPERAMQEKRYLKSELVFYGATVWQTAAAVKDAVAKRPKPSHDELIGLASELWEAPVHERRAAAVMLLEHHVDVLGPADMAFFERLVRESRTWALVDELAGDLVAALLMKHPQIASDLDRWATDDDFWVRHAALLAHLRRIRRGDELGDFARYADAMLDEREFFIRKAIGWVLREAAKRRPADVVAWLAPRTGRASGVTMREAVKYLPPTEAQRLMVAYGEKRPAD